MDSKTVLKSLLVAALIGVPIAVVAMALMEAIHLLEHGIWYDLPDAVDSWNGVPPWWFVIAVPTGASAIAAMLLSKARGDVSHAVGMTATPLRHLPWLLLGAVATLAGGIVLGPEAPLLAVGITFASLAAARTATAHATGDEPDPYVTILSLAGATIVLGMVLASPLVAIVLMFEILAASGRIPSKQISAVLAPGMLAAAIGSLVFAGVNSWSGIDPPTLNVPDLPAYSEVQLVDVAWSPLVAIVAALVVLAMQRGSTWLAPLVQGHVVKVTIAFGFATGVLAVAYRAVTDRPIGDVLFSGQTALPTIVTIDAAWILALLILAKGTAYMMALAGRFEGGQIFPALAVSGAVGVIASIVLPGANLTAMLAVSIAAGTTSIQRLPIFGTVFGVLIVTNGNLLEIGSLALIGGVLGFVASLAIDKRHAADASSAPAEPAPAG